jgi:hypothetical protein
VRAEKIWAPPSAAFVRGGIGFRGTESPVRREKPS